MTLRAGRRTVKVLAAGFVVAGAFGAAGAQDAALGNIAGEVRDITGAVIPNAPVVVTDKETGASRTLMTDSAGHYSATFLQPGHYQVVIGGGASFGTVNNRDVAVTVGCTGTLDATQPPSTITTDGHVSADAHLLDTEKVETAQTVSQAIVANLPVNGRRFDNFVLLTSNVVPDGNTGLISYRGISGLYNTNLVAGANNLQEF